MINLLTLVCTVVLVTSCGIVTSQDAPEDVWNAKLFETLGENGDLVVKELSKAAPEHEAVLHGMLDKITRADNGQLPDNSTGCVGCQLIVTVLTYLVKMGYTMEQLQAPAEAICRVLFTIQNGFLNPDAGNKVCPGVITNFGHHVERVLRLNRNLPEESCYFLKSCSNELPSFTLPPLIGFLGISSTKTWKMPKTANNYRTKRRANTQRDWHQDKDILRVAQFTDIHVDKEYLEGAFTKCGMPLCCRDLPSGWRPGEGSARKYGEYLCNVPPETTRMFLAKTKSLNPDVILYSGDSPPHHLWEETLEGQMNSTMWVAEELNENFPNVMGIYSTLGNHECFPSNMYYPDHEDTQALHDTFIGAYKELSNLGAEQLETFNKNGYYTVKITDKLRIVAPNSNFGYTANWYNLLHMYDPRYAEMVTWLDATLEKARTDGEKVIMLSHHPMHGNVRGYDDMFSAHMVKYSDIIILNVVGHNHKDEFRVFRDDTGAGKGVQFLSQSANSYSDVNPGVRMYYFDNITYSLLGYEQYYLDITQEGANVTLLYKTDVEYSLNDLSATSMLDFAARMDSENTLFEKFYKNRVTGANTQSACDAQCKRNMLCSQVTATDEDLERCRSDDAPFVTAPPIISTTDEAISIRSNAFAYLLPILLLVVLL